MTTNKTILSFAASNSKQSINKKLVRYAAKVLQNPADGNIQINMLDLNDYEMPIYSIDREQETGIPDEAKRFYSAIGEADALLISFAEHNGNVSAAYKNIFDWCSRIDSKVFQNKPMVVLSASPGGRGGANARQIAIDSAPHFAGLVKGGLSVGKFSENFDEETQQLSNPELAAELSKQLAALELY